MSNGVGIPASVPMVDVVRAFKPQPDELNRITAQLTQAAIRNDTEKLAECHAQLADWRKRNGMTVPFTRMSIETDEARGEGRIAA